MKVGNMSKGQMARSTWLLAAALGSLLLGPRIFAVESDYEFQQPQSCGSKAETGEDDASSALAEGFEGLTAEPAKNLMIEPIDGAGGFDNVAPKLAVEEGPGGLEWDLSPTYRTRYSGETNYPAGATQLQGNNWFTNIPYIAYDGGNSKFVVRFNANTFRVYDRENGYSNYWLGRYANKNSRIYRSGSGSSEVEYLYDTRGKKYTFPATAFGKCTEIEGAGGHKISFSYSTGSITVSQGTNVRRFTYTITSNRIDKIDIEQYLSGVWALYRKVNFTYHEDVTGAQESTTGDLVGIEDEKLLSPSSTWYKRRWIFKYYTGTYNSSTNPGYPYQVKAVLAPQSYHQFVLDNSGQNDTYVYTRTASQLSSYVDRTYEYASDRRLSKLDIKSGCGCGSGEGVYTYTWSVNGSQINDLNTWYHQATITLPSVNGSSRFIDYNTYGQKLNDIAQEVAADSGSRRWISTWRHDTTGRLTDSYSPLACTSYSSHSVTTDDSNGQHFKYAYDTNSTLTTVKLHDSANGDFLQIKKVITPYTSGDKKRFLKTLEALYPIDTTIESDSNRSESTFSYTFHGTTLAVKLRTTTLPAIESNENGSGSAIVLKDYFESDGLHTWSKDGDGFVHYNGYDANRRTQTKVVVDLNTQSPPSGVPSSPDTNAFYTTSGLNLVTDMAYDFLRRMVKLQSPSFDAWDGSSVTSVRTTKQWWYTKLATDDLVTLEYPHVDDSSYKHTSISLTLQDFEGHVITAALGNLNSSYRNTTISDDFDATQSTLDAGFHGIIARRTEYSYDGDKVSEEKVWSVANDTNSTKYSTTNTYDATGRMVTTTNPVSTITRFGYDVLNRKKSTKIGTIDGGGSDNMKSVEELFYDDEQEEGVSHVGDSNLTCRRLYTDTSTYRESTYVYDYRRRMIEAHEPGTDEPDKILETRDYNFYEPTSGDKKKSLVVQRYDTSSGSVLMAKTESHYDTRGQIYETWTYGVSGGTASGYASVRTWRNGRGQDVKTLNHNARE